MTVSDKLTITKCHFEPGIRNKNSQKKQLQHHLIVTTTDFLCIRSLGNIPPLLSENS